MFGYSKNKKSSKIGTRLALSVVLVLISYLAMVSALFAWITIVRTPGSTLGASSTGYSFDILLSCDGGLSWKQYSEDEPCRFDNVFSGGANSKTLLLLCKNNSAQRLRFSWFFRAVANGEEVPYFDGNLYYYLGSQLQVLDITSSIGNENLTSQGKGSFLVKTSSAGVESGQVTGVLSTVLNIGEQDLASLTLESGAQAVLSFDFAFVDNGQNQSIYSPFEGSCVRRLSVSIKSA